jgi:hypothetical protein
MENREGGIPVFIPVRRYGMPTAGRKPLDRCGMKDNAGCTVHPESREEAVR